MTSRISISLLAAAGLLLACDNGSLNARRASQVGSQTPTAAVHPSAHGVTEPKEAPQDATWAGGFVAHPTAALLCRQHVTGAPGQGHIEWSAYATSDAPGTVVAFYRAHLGQAKIDSAATSRLTLKAPDGSVLSVHARGDQFPTCDKEPAPDAQTVLIVSQMIR